MTSATGVTKSHAYTLIVSLFTAILLISNIASTKLFGLWETDIIIDGGTILFPLAYILGDVITEVYGFKRAKFIIFCGFIAMALMSATLFAVQLLPPASDWANQGAYEAILGLVPRIAIGSLIAYMVGELLNSYVMAAMKAKTNGKYLWARALGSTVVGALADTVLFSTIAFAGIIPADALIGLIATVYLIKLIVEVAVLPITYRVVKYLKRIEGEAQ